MRRWRRQVAKLQCARARLLPETWLRAAPTEALCLRAHSNRCQESNRPLTLLSGSIPAAAIIDVKLNSPPEAPVVRN